MRKVQVLIELGSYPYISGFNTPMVRAIKRGVIRLSDYIGKIEGNVFKKGFLVGLGREMVMGLSLFNQISCQFTLS